jgi:hypothetical protein
MPEDRRKIRERFPLFRKLQQGCFPRFLPRQIRHELHRSISKSIKKKNQLMVQSG